ncbi:MAG: hypothetical protein AB7I50_03800 [Vicinamibacterales bacterium]
MTRRFPGALFSLSVGHAITLGLYVGLINTPESNVAMLLVSGVLALALIASAGLTESLAFLWLHTASPLRAVVGQALARFAPAFLASLSVLGAAWLVTSRIRSWYEARAGELDAWFIATLDMANTLWAHHAMRAMLFAGCWIVGVSCALALLGAILLRGTTSGLMSADWLKRAIVPRQLAVVGLIVLLCFVAPLWVLEWRPPVSQGFELTAVGLKLAGIYLATQLGCALLLLVAPTSRQSPPSDSAAPTQAADCS